MNCVYQNQENTTTFPKCLQTKISTLFTRGKALLQFAFLLVISSLLLANGASAQATVKTDLLDYPPGATAILTGTGWQPGETVTLQVLHVDGNPLGADPQYHQPFTTVADASGNITSSWLVPNDGDALGAHFKLTADGVSSLRHAEWFFTDGNTVTFNTPTQVGTVNSGTSGTVTYNFTVTKDNGNNNITATFGAAGLPAGTSAARWIFRWPRRISGCKRRPRIRCRVLHTPERGRPTTQPGAHLETVFSTWPPLLRPCCLAV